MDKFEKYLITTLECATSRQNDEDKKGDLFGEAVTRGSRAMLEMVLDKYREFLNYSDKIE